jgi:hypothetical protein
MEYLLVYHCVNFSSTVIDPSFAKGIVFADVLSVYNQVLKETVVTIVLVPLFVWEMASVRLGST